MICDPVLTVGFGLIPIEVDDVAGIWSVAAVLPLIAGSEPAFTGDTASGFRDNICVDIPALIGAPGNETGAPLYTGFKPHVRPIGIAGVADLRQRDRYNVS